jgi:hypothetical protein
MLETITAQPTNPVTPSRVLAIAAGTKLCTRCDSFGLATNSTLMVVVQATAKSLSWSDVGRFSKATDGLVCRSFFGTKSLAIQFPFTD